VTLSLLPPRIEVDSAENDYLQNADVAVDDDGDFVVTWLGHTSVN
jgi:hypothetical protein